MEELWAVIQTGVGSVAAAAEYLQRNVMPPRVLVFSVEDREIATLKFCVIFVSMQLA
jgi:hypothetical protein